MLAKNHAALFRTLTVIVCAAVLGGCGSTRRISDHEVRVPAGLTEAEVREGVLRAADTFKTQTPGYMALGGGQGNQWSLENAAPGYFEAVLRHKALDRYGPVVRTDYNYQVRIGVWYTATELRTRVIGGHAIRFDGERVHKSALKWQGKLDERLESELRFMASRKADPS